MSLRREATIVRLLMNRFGLDQVVNTLAIDSEHAANGLGAPNQIRGRVMGTGLCARR
jgi:hypothetical protein